MFVIKKKTLVNLLCQQTQIIVAAIKKEGESIMSTQSTSITDVQNSLDALTKAGATLSLDALLGAHVKRANGGDYLVMLAPPAGRPPRRER